MRFVLILLFAMAAMSVSFATPIVLLGQIGGYAVVSCPPVEDIFIVMPNCVADTTIETEIVIPYVDTGDGTISFSKPSLILVFMLDDVLVDMTVPEGVFIVEPHFENDDIPKYVYGVMSLVLQNYYYKGGE